MIKNLFQVLLNVPLKIFLWFSIVTSFLGLIFDTFHTFSVGYMFIFYVNILTLILITSSIIIYRIYKRDIRIPSVAYTLSLGLAMAASEIYLLMKNVVFWQQYFLRDTTIYVLLLILSGLILHKFYTYAINGLYCLVVIFICYRTKDNFVKDNAVFLIILLSAFSVGIVLYSKKLKDAFKQNEQLHILLAKKEKEILEKENQRIAEQNSMLKKTVEIKNKELVSRAMFLAEHVEKNNFLAKKLESFENFIDSNMIRELKNIVNNLKTSDDSHWEEFQIRFNLVHQDFYSNIKKDFPDLTTGELKLAALIKLQLSSKEISILTNTTKAGIEVSRSRLRKKLQMDKKDNMFDFLDKY